MQSRRDEIKKMVFETFLRYGKTDGDNAMRMKLLINDLDELGVPVIEIQQALKICVQKSAFVPTLADVIGVFRGVREAEIEAEINEKWAYFLKNALSCYAKLEDWAYTAKKALGWSRVEATTDRDLPFLKKEFWDVCKRLINNELDVQPDPRNWKLIGSTWCLGPASESQNAMFTIADAAKKFLSDRRPG